ncbi:MAG: hypothetical protein Q9221_007302 [Calogaya cf. arnoldii]
MFNPLFDLPVLTTLVLHALLSIIVAALPRCWDVEASAQPLVFRENEIIVHKIGLTYDRSRRPFDPSLPLVFSRDPVPLRDIKTPKTWYNEDDADSGCLIGVDIPSYLGGSDKTSLHDIKMAAMAIAVECVIKGRHLGGILQIGWAHKINVVITSLSEPRNVRERKKVLNGTLEEA